MRALARIALCAALAGCGDPLAPEPPEPGEELSGGAATVFDDSDDAFGLPAPGLSRGDERTFLKGRALFRDDWVQAPSSTTSRDGLGPLFNARSCIACHERDGRGTASLLFRLSVAGRDALTGAPVPEPTYGDQLQPRSILGLDGGEARFAIGHEALPGQYADGTPYTLQQPIYAIEDGRYGPFADDMRTSPRLAPSMIGLGLLEAVPEADVLALADPDDADGDGISGRPNVVWAAETASTALGRFGWKANQPTVRQQSAGAFAGDLGITSSVFPDEGCTAAQTDCAEAQTGGSPELDELLLENVVLYARAIAVPARRDWDDPAVLRGKQLFADAGCAGCHTPVLVTGPDELAPLAHQTIRPYTDLLLHDLGEALADGRDDFEADGREWRTTPLWGLGLLETVNGHTFLLHDGRARGIAEAILWHGGEAEAAREAFRTMPASDRAAMLRFLESL